MVVANVCTSRTVVNNVLNLCAQSGPPDKLSGTLSALHNALVTGICTALRISGLREIGITIRDPLNSSLSWIPSS